MMVSSQFSPGVLMKDDLPKQSVSKAARCTAPELLFWARRQCPRTRTRAQEATNGSQRMHARMHHHHPRSYLSHIPFLVEGVAPPLRLFM